MKLLLYGLVVLASEHYTQGLNSLRCRSATNCTSCIQLGPACAWCFQPDLLLPARCDQPEALESNGCNRSNIFVPQTKVELLRTDSLRNADFQSKTPAVQLSPQHVHLRLTPGRPANFSLRFRVAEDYPVDLYYLMDLSLSMQDDLQSLTNLGLELREALLSITQNVRLGFGAFVDKPTMPYIDIRPVAIDNPCFPAGNCTRAYGYVNRLPLTGNTSVFVNRVMSSAISANLDGAEGGLDALVQAIVCQTDVGWRAQARKLLLYATDDASHFSGDGKLGGILEPNDGQCHMDNDYYTYSTHMDYPSLGQVASIVKARSVNVIFAIADAYKEFYTELAKLLPGSVTAVLASDSSNVVNLVKDNYQAIIAKVELSVEGLDTDGSISVRTSSSCRSGPNVETRTCDGLKIGDTVPFDVQITLNSCPVAATRGQSTRKTIYISVFGLEEKLRVDIDIDCSCDCNDKEPSSITCGSRGLYSCGSCYCDGGFVGSRCECDESTAVAKAPLLQKLCTRPSGRLPCSGRGVCTACGNCDCSCLPQAGVEVGYCSAGDRYTGDFCECNPRGCNSYNGLVCGGQGTCRCDSNGKNFCECNEQFDNGGYAACECPKSTDACKVDGSEGAICNGKGTCSCGVCQCTDSCYTGITCSTVKPECSGSCQEFRPCIECLKQDGNNCPSKCQNVKVNTVESAPSDSLQTCRYTDDEACELTFTFSFDRTSNRHKVDIINGRKCPRDLLIPLIAGIVGGVLFLGLLALGLWKLAVTIYDRKEFERFQKEAQRAKWNTEDNPLYEKATTTFKNPTYAGRK